MKVRIDGYKKFADRSKTTPYLALVVPVAKELHPAIETLQDRLREVDPRQIYHASEYLHVTVKRLGWLNDDVKETDLPAIFEIIQTELLLFNAFSIALRGLSFFPDVVYLRVNDPTQSMKSLNKRLLERLGNMTVHYPYEGDSFVPHATITTFKTTDVEKLLNKVSELADISVGTMHVFEMSAARFYIDLAYGKPEEENLAMRPVRSFALKPCCWSAAQETTHIGAGPLPNSQGYVACL